MPALPKRYLRPLLAATLGLLAIATARAEDPAPDQASCITRGLEPDSRLAGTATARLALRSCLATATPSPGLCAGAPAPDGSDVTGLEAWYIKGCPGKSLTSDHCHQLMDEVAAYCRETAAGG